MLGRLARVFRTQHRRRYAEGLPADVPIVLVSSCRSVEEGGDVRYNGGVKLYNLLVKLLRSRGMPAFVVTYDGRYDAWLLDHQPHVSLDTARRWKRAGFPLRFVTGWAEAQAFIDLADELYFYDCELAYTAGPHFGTLSKLLGSKIRRVATHSRTQQAWYMATFGFAPTLIPIWSDPAYWFDAPAARRPGLVGYTYEGEETEPTIAYVSDLCRRAGVAAQFKLIQGDERAVLGGMQQCDLFLGLNPAKHPLWGEGSPITQLEAIQAGAVVVAYDVNGNREYLVDGYSGYVVPRGHPEMLAREIIRLMRDPEEKERTRAQSLGMARAAFGCERRWTLWQSFLDLPERPWQSVPGKGVIPDRVRFAELLQAPAYIGEEEISVFARYARASANGTLVEIGAGYGASTVLMLLHAPTTACVVSVDPFLPDSMTGFQVTPGECQTNVYRALARLGAASAVARWTLVEQASGEVSQQWDRPIDFLYIDGDHNYEAVRRDFLDWARFLRKDGVLLLHDSRRDAAATDDRVFARGWPGPTRLARELQDHSCVELVEEAFSLTVWRKTGGLCPQCSS